MINSDPVKERAYLSVTFHVQYPSNADLLDNAPTKFVLPKATVEGLYSYCNEILNRELSINKDVTKNTVQQGRYCSIENANGN